MFSQEKADRILSGLADGKSLRAVCASSDDLPSHSTVLAWLDNADFAEFANQYAIVRARSYRLLADEIIEISAAPTDAEDSAVSVARARLEVDSRKWMLSKMLPKVYGDKLDLNHSGRIVTSREMSEEELASIAAGGQ